MLVESERKQENFERKIEVDFPNILITLFLG